MGYTLYLAISWFARLLTFALAGRAILSWFAQNPYSGPGKAYQIVVRLTEPLVVPCRMLIQRMNINTGMVDFSVFLAMVLVQFMANILMFVVRIIF